MSRQIIIGTEVVAVPTPSLGAVVGPIKVLMPTTVSLPRVVDFVDLVRHVRHLNTLFRATLDYAIKREMEKLEFQLDAVAGFLAADLVAVAVNDPTRPTTGEGGSS